MFLLISIMSISFILVCLLKVLSIFVRERSLLIREELTSFECGFEHHNVSRVPFSLRYFFLTLIFLLFDLEIVLMLFLPSMIFISSYFLTFVIILTFIVILYLSLIYE